MMNGQKNIKLLNLWFLHSNTSDVVLTVDLVFVHEEEHEVNDIHLTL
jgi:hypothetical protein